ncbi:unnamed protein product [Amoebophrya sp. A25]|nr:unnamed protein product [Amoebophrya sp. A25]|eukprot:GSA25T00012411001.1
MMLEVFSTSDMRPLSNKDRRNANCMGMIAEEMVGRDEEQETGMGMIAEEMVADEEQESKSSIQRLSSSKDVDDMKINNDLFSFSAISLQTLRVLLEVTCMEQCQGRLEDILVDSSLSSSSSTSALKRLQRDVAASLQDALILRQTSKIHDGNHLNPPLDAVCIIAREVSIPPYAAHMILRPESRWEGNAQESGNEEDCGGQQEVKHDLDEFRRRSVCSHS